MLRNITSRGDLLLSILTDCILANTRKILVSQNLKESAELEEMVESYCTTNLLPQEMIQLE